MVDLWCKVRSKRDYSLRRISSTSKQYEIGRKSRIKYEKISEPHTQKQEVLK